MSYTTVHSARQRQWGPATNNSTSKASKAVRWGAGMCSEGCDERTTRATRGPLPCQLVVRLYEPRNTNLQHSITTYTTTVLQPLFRDHPGEPVPEEKFWTLWCKERYNRGRHTDHLVGCHSIRTNQCLSPPSPIFYSPDAIPAAQPTVSKHWRQQTTTHTGG